MAMADMIDKAGLPVAATLVRFIEEDVLPGTGIEPDALWGGMADVYARFAPENRALLETRDALQVKIDAWHEAHPELPVIFAGRSRTSSKGSIASITARASPTWKMRFQTTWPSASPVDALASILGSSYQSVSRKLMR